MSYETSEDDRLPDEDVEMMEPEEEEEGDEEEDDEEEETPQPEPEPISARRRGNGNSETKDSNIVLDFRNKRTGMKASVVAKYSKESDAIIAKVVSGRNIRYLKINLRPIRKLVLNSLSNQVGWSWRDVKKASGRLVRKVGSKKLLMQITKVINDPRFAKGMMAASTVFPALGITYAAVKASSKLVEAASAGDGNAIDRIKRIKALAENGDLDALRTVRAMGAMHEAKKGGADIGAWYDSIVAKNANPDRPNVITQSRGVYSTGLNAPMKIIDVKVF